MSPPTILELVYLVCIAHVWSRGTIFRWLRTHGPKPWVMLADCPLCSGWWVGAIGHLLYVTVPTVIVWLGTASVVATSTLLVYCLIRKL